jgi:BMFP domain-containing protein YqiC
MASQSNPNKPIADNDSDAPARASAEEVLRPFQSASAKFLQASAAARDAALQQCAQAWLDFHDEVRKAEQEAYQTMMAATRKHVGALGQPAAGTADEAYAARARSHFDYEREVRQIYADTQAKLSAIAQKSCEGGRGDAVRQFSKQHQDAFQAYQADLQRAWSGAKALDPQALSAIGATILFTIHAVSHGG